jgi:hypothetical protein
MKLRKTILIGVGAILLLQTKSFSQSSQPTVDTNALMQMVKNYAADLAANPPLSSEGFSNKMVALDYAYRHEKIDKGMAMAENIILQHNQAQNIYGKVIDQNGQPVAQVDVTAGLMVLDLNKPYLERPENHKTQTDTNGLFEFTGLRGSGLGASVSKQGYEINGAGMKGAVGQQSSPTDRVTFTMWKLRGAEPMISSRFDSRVPYDGTSATFNLETARKVTNGVSDLRITLLRTPLKIRRGRDRYDWTAKIEIINGGLLEERDAYPNFAPKDGYQSSFNFSMSSNSVPWNGELSRKFYFKSAKEQYGRLSIDLSTDSERPETGVTIAAWLNPSGSQNLEIDQSKLTKIWKY